MDRLIQINQELCTSCGACVDACSVGAIQFMNQRTMIDRALCIKCDACMDACPNEAITALPIPLCSASTRMLPAAKSYAIAVRNLAALPAPSDSVHRLALLTGTALAYVGQKALPYIVDGLMATLERRLAGKPIKSTAPPAQPVAMPGQARHGQAWQSQQRRRCRNRQTQ